MGNEVLTARENTQTVIEDTKRALSSMYDAQYALAESIMVLYQQSMETQDERKFGRMDTAMAYRAFSELAKGLDGLDAVSAAINTAEGYVRCVDAGEAE